ncbi:HEAT repeat domain-containing protein [Methanosarcina sp. 2.H.A.1B.4]|uniref:HEAT repeat domain-containing protein n=1 Tax=Methanosarcina sp. 2.H.A.1B.4 TaxID=1483600 RepID=UPI0006227E95|nr:HEAT repeat domain-containing protein [Methanosarcina sp. 2.H.A.1B.4]KKG09334.1 phycocyanin subunit alpha [Methanosarcina sp. 2.H.A.1B.4]
MPVTERISKGELEKYLKGVILEDSTEEISNFYTELSVREILPITRQLFEEKVCLTREFEVLQFVKKEKHLIVYGEAGSGKTWTLRWLGTACARKCLEKKEGFVPIYAALDSYVKGSFYDYLRGNAGKKGISGPDFRKLLEGKALLLLDGLDTLTPSDNFSPYEEISDFISEYEDCRYVFASRPRLSGSIRNRFAVCELEKMTDEKVRDFIEKHIPDEEQANFLKAAVLKGNHSNTVLRNPLMLSLWLEIAGTSRGIKENEKNVEASFPSSRAEIYEAYISELFRDFTAEEAILSAENVYSVKENSVKENSVKENSVKEKSGKENSERIIIENILTDLSFKLQCVNKVSCKYKYALEVAGKYVKYDSSGRYGSYIKKEARKLLQACFGLGLLRRKGSEIRLGIHQSFQEYFAALKLKTYFENGMEISDTFGHPEWEDVIIFTSELVESGEELVNSIILSGNLCLASKCAGKAGPETKEKLCALLARKLDSKFTVEKLRAIQSLGSLGVCGIEAVSEAFHDEEISVRREAVRILGETKSEAALVPLTAALGDGDYSVRREAVKALGVIGSERATELLTNAFADQERAVRLEATEALAQIKSERALEILVGALKAKDDFVRWGAIGALGRANPENAADLLIKAFQEGDNFVRLGAAETLGQMRSEKAAGILVEALEDEEEFVRWIATKELGKIKLDKSSDIFIGALGDKSHFVRREAAKALGMTGAEKAIAPLISALSDEDELVRKAAAEALGEIGTKRAVDPLISLLGDESHSVRIEAARALGMIESGKAVSPLLLALGDENRFVRRGAAKALGQLKLEKTLEPLICTFESGNSFVRQEAIRALGLIKSDGVLDRMSDNSGRASDQMQDSSDRALDMLIDALEDEDEFVRREAAKALGNCSEKEAERALKPLINALEDKEGEVRRFAAEALVNLDPRKSIEPLISALKSEDEMVRRLAVEALGRIKSKKAIKPLIDVLLCDEAGFVRSEAARALGKIKAEKTIDPLIEALIDENNDGRWGAAEALGRIKAEKAVDPLINALADIDDFTRWAAARALGRIKPKKAIEPLINTLYDWNRFVKAEAACALSEICTKSDKAQLQALLASENKFAANLAFEILESFETEEKSKVILFKEQRQVHMYQVW